MGATAVPRIVAFGEDAWLIELGEAIEAELNASAHALAQAADELRSVFPGVQRAVVAYASVLVPFDSHITEPDRLHAALVALVADVLPAVRLPEGRLIDVPVRYGGEHGPDLAYVAERSGLSADTVIATHAEASYRVFMLGFSPGFAYLGLLAPQLRLPRRAEPRLRVPPGSVAIASSQTAVYPHATAGGWHLIGHTDTSFWDITAADPAHLRPGDRVRFRPV